MSQKVSQLDKELAALRLLNPDWDKKSKDDQLALHHTLMWTIEALVEVELLKWNTNES